MRPASAPPLAHSIFAALPGTWTLRREIADVRLGGGSFTGTAVFAAQADNTLLYHEQGQLALGAWRGPAWRSWIYALEGDALSVRYPNTLAELHRFVFAAAPSGGLGAMHLGAARAHAMHVHICGEDRYAAHLEWGGDGSFVLAYRVTGPAKDYRLRTLLARA